MNTLPDDNLDERADEFRDGLIDKLKAQGMIPLPVVEQAFRAVPRHRFVPEGTPLEVAYNADDSVAIKRDSDGVIISSTSAPFIQARMIEQARLGRDMTVLEIGSGGYNAALLAEVTGPGGRVISVDIDSDVVERARAALEATGYDDRVVVLHADADRPVGGLDEPFDTILVTVGAWDFAPAWLEQLAPTGTIVLPLRMKGISRSIAFRREGDHLVSTSSEVCGFVTMQGAGAVDERVFLLPDGKGHNVKLRFDDGEPPQDMSQLDGVLATERTEVWSQVTISHGVSFADMYLWFAGFMPGFCKIAVDEGTEMAADRKNWFPFGVVRGDSFAYLAIHRLDSGVEFGARAYGPNGTEVAAAMVEQIQAWDRLARGGPEPTYAYWPHAVTRPAASDNTAVLEKTHGLLTITWPTPDQATPREVNR
ncbi:protein-L-isoaspartate(D-aspartate) O-methyltransferase [Actinokineospora baliensis]|uniref:methyltransferase, FxLD system n=1 Tax=Actinokineospora baliensis TaxID=547056 RepID=UPI00195738E1|nr:methyltransferase, FxLD system [Actinokineospora baliensis]MBM7776001.1 protein-L-isoaspartate(D-aspartate) O-methyltransferase [Actinokineospora baliensis]